MKVHFWGTGSAVPTEERNCQTLAIECNGYFYIFDCGAPLAEVLSKNNIPYSKIKAIFLSHIHRDHISGIFTFACLYAFNVQQLKTNIFCPVKEWAEALVSLIKATAPDKKYDETVFNFSYGKEGGIYFDDNITVTAIPTMHQKNINYPSYAFMIEGEKKRIIITGDLLFDASDFPKIAMEIETDAIITELHHFGPQTLYPILRQCETEKALIIHIDEINREKFELSGKDSGCEFPIYFPKDNQIYEI